MNRSEHPFSLTNIPEALKNLVKPFVLLADPIHQFGLALALNRVFSEEILYGEIDFLYGKTVRIYVSDFNIEWLVTLVNGQFAVKQRGGEYDVSIIADSEHFISLILRTVDPDTLFFKRLISIEGDTALGIEVKNLLDGFDPENLPEFLKVVISNSSL
ncbi:MAG: SCP2 domain-containing protein [Gammaproteobacteria bacterium]|nr:MAG: SCP2 domain-containing protein [Gammaproteobacteria bacterium]